MKPPKVTIIGPGSPVEAVRARNDVTQKREQEVFRYLRRTVVAVFQKPKANYYNIIFKCPYLPIVTWIFHEIYRTNIIKELNLLRQSYE